MTKLFKSTLFVVAALLTSMIAVAAESENGHVTTVRSWDFTKGKNHANEISDCEYWGAVDSKGRTALQKALEDKELPSNTGAALSGLDGVYFTVGTGAVYGITKNNCFQHGQMKVRIPNCGRMDEIVINFCGAGSEATISSGNISESLSTSSTSKQEQKTYVNQDGDVVLDMKCSKGFRLYSITVNPAGDNPQLRVSYYNTNGTLLGTEMVDDGSELTYKYTAADVTVPEGCVFRGWFDAAGSKALKVKEGTVLNHNYELYARATKKEEALYPSRYVYDLTKPYFYVEDHECIDIDGQYHNEHGWLVGKGSTITLQVAGRAYVSVGCCTYSTESTATVTDYWGNTVATFPVKAASDGEEFLFEFGNTLITPRDPLTITFPEGAYIHSVMIGNVWSFAPYDESTGYYLVPSGDATCFLMALKKAASRDGAKIFLQDGVYDLGETVLTEVKGKNISIIGESMKGTVIVNCPPIEEEGISKTATLLNRSENLYLQDLTLRNAMPFDGSQFAGRAVTLQDKGKNTICKNVSLESYQDTYYSNNSSAYFYFEDGEIHGVVDYVCGGGDVYFNRVKFVNEKVKNSTIAAPNGAKKFGYVMDNCTIETLCSQFNFGRSWGAYSGLAWLNTTINQPSKLASSRFTVAGMNCAADKFVEYNSMDANGNCISPSSKVIEFTHSSGNKKYETILTAEQAAEYALDKVFPDWKPNEIAAQVTYTEGETEGIYLVGGEIYANELPIPTNGMGGTLLVRKANARGGFGPEVSVEYNGGTNAINNVGSASVKNVKATYNLAGQKVCNDFVGTRIVVYNDGTSKKVMK